MPRRRRVQFTPSTPWREQAREGVIPPSTELSDFANIPTSLEPGNLNELRTKTLEKLYRATGWKGADEEWFEERDGQTVLRRNKAELVANVPTLQQLGVRKTVDLENVNLEGQNQSPFDPEEVGSDRRAERTYAVLNHPLLHADGPRSLGITVAAITSAAGILPLTAAISAPLLLAQKSPVDRSGVVQDLLVKIGFPASRFSLGQCINQGAAILLGLNRPIENPGDVSALLGNIVADVAASLLGTGTKTPLVDSPLFYLHLFRTVFDGASEVQDAAKDLANARSINSLREFIDSIKDLGAIKFLTLAAQLGDEILKRLRGVTDDNPDAGELESPGETWSAVRDRPHRAWLNRGVAGGYRQSSSLRDLPGAWVPPATLRNPARSTSVFEKYNPVLAPGSDKEGRERMLDELGRTLEAEYLPFWIQDMRTSEVTAFHAFLDSFSDSYSPQVNPEQTMGRMDPVNIYSNTSRTINLSFVLYATQRDEHDTLWSIVNWLTTLIYPTWSDGIKVDEETGQTSPFGRVPSASPLIRLRLGDMLRSNAGEESLRRLLTHEDKLRSSLNGNLGNYERTRERAQRSVYNEFEIEEGATFYLAPNPAGFFIVGPDESGLERLASRFGSDSLRGRSLKTNEMLWFEPERIVDEGAAAEGRVYKVNESGLRGDPFSIIVDGEPQDDFIVRVGRQDLFPADLATGATDWVDFLDQELSRVDGPDEIAAQTVELEERRPATLFSNRSERFDLKKLSFIKSLRKGALDGLAGMINSFEVDYNFSDPNNFALELEPGSIAPIGVRVTLGMNVIHDIQPGKDSLGGNRAPIYGVGGPSRDAIGDFRGREAEKRPSQSDSVGGGAASRTSGFAQGLRETFSGSGSTDDRRLEPRNKLPSGDGRG